MVARGESEKPGGEKIRNVNKIFGARSDLLKEVRYKPRLVK